MRPIIVIADVCTCRGGHCQSPQMERTRTRGVSAALVSVSAEGGVPSNEGSLFVVHSQYNRLAARRGGWCRRKCQMDVQRISPHPNHGAAWGWRLVAGCALAAQMLAPALGSSAGLYRCVDATGQAVFTDRPAQMAQCVPLSVESSASAPLSSSSAPTPPAPASTELSLATRLIPPEPLATSTEAGIVIPVRRIGQLYVVPVELNGTRTANLIVDTGASHTILSEELVRDLALLPADFRPGLVMLKTAGGSVDAQVVRIDSMKIATAEVRNSTAAVRTVPDFPAGVDGLLGLSFLHQFEVTLDTAKGELRLRRGAP